MVNFNLFVNPNNLEEIIAISKKISKLMAVENRLVKVGSLTTELRSGIYPLTTDYSLSDIYAMLANEPQVKEVENFSLENCDRNEVDNLINHYIESMKFEGNIHSLDYNGDVDAVPENFRQGHSRNFYHNKIDGLRLDSQFFASEGYQIQVFESLISNCDIIIPGINSTHCYVAKDSTKEEYDVQNQIGVFRTSMKVASEAKSIKLISFEEVGDFLKDN